MQPFEIGRLTRLDLGYVGETGSREIQIDMSEWLERWPDGKIAVDVLKPGRKEYYLADTTVEDGILTWTVTYTDVAKAGRGMAQISIYDFGTSKVYKSRCVETIIRESADMAEDLEAPHPMDTWVARAVEAKEGALGAALSAAQSASVAKAAETVVVEARDRAEAAAAAAENSETIAANASANATEKAAEASASAAAAERYAADAQNAAGAAENAAGAAINAMGTAGNAMTKAQESAAAAETSAQNAQGSMEAAKGVLDSIPEDYTTLSQAIDQLALPVAVPDLVWESGTITGLGYVVTNAQSMRTQMVKVESFGRLTAELKDGNVTLYIAEYDASEKFLRRNVYYFPGENTPSDDCVYARLIVYSTTIAAEECPNYLRVEYKNASIPAIAAAVEVNRVRMQKLPNIPIKSTNHRGFHTAPENTLPAYRLSAQKGFPCVECDINTTSDGVLVLLHDDNINRTARNADGSELSTAVTINTVTYADLAQYDFGVWKGAQYAGTPIPTFEEFLLLCKQLGLHPYIELKNTTACPFTDAMASTLVDIVKRYDMINHVTYISNDIFALGKVVALDKTARVGLNMSGEMTAYWAKRMRSVGMDTGVNEVFIHQLASAVSDTTFDIAQQYGWSVEVYCPNTEAEILALDPRVSGYTSDILVAVNVLRHANIGGTDTGVM